MLPVRNFYCQLLFLPTILFYAFVHVNSVWAVVSMKLPFTDHMVLQRNAKVNIWGTAEAGEVVTVQFAGQTKSTTTNRERKWILQLDPMLAAGPLTMVVSGTNKLTFTDVYVGEVWQCAGQSNMDLTLGSTEWKGAYEGEIAGANFPKLRYMKTRGTPAGWNVISPSTAGGCSATGYFFGKDLLQNLDCAVGLLVTAVGGTTIEQWFDPVSVQAFRDKTDGSIAAGSMYNQYVLPVIPFTMKGTVWIQGEQNASKGFGARDYGDRFKSVITNWRKAWGQGEFPFYFGQLTGINTTQTSPFPTSNAAWVREGQREALELSETAMSVMLDISGGGWHYTNKKEAGRRLALAPIALLYGKELEYAGPTLHSCAMEGNDILLEFTHAAGLTTNDGKGPAQIGICGSDGEWYFADKTEIKDNTVIVSSSRVPNPRKVCMGWNDRPRINLYNKEGLQASPFLMDLGTITGLNKIYNSVATMESGIFPNPVAGNELYFIPGLYRAGLEATISDFHGKIHFHRKYPENMGDIGTNIPLDISTLPQGIFLIQIKEGNSLKTFPLIRH